MPPFPTDAQGQPRIVGRAVNMGAFEFQLLATPPPDATWLPWRSQSSPNILIFRNMLPAASFRQSVQAAAAAGCPCDNEPGLPVPYAEIVDAGQCAHAVMGEYYPTAVYCDKQLFISQGWQGCFTAAGVAVP